MTYKDVKEQNKILPKKQKYTKADMNRLVKNGTSPGEARFICLCSAVHYDVDCSKSLYAPLD